MPSTARAPKGVQAPAPVAVHPPVADAPDGSYRDFPVLADLPAAIAEYRRLQLEIASVEPAIARKKEIGALIESLLLAADTKSVTVGAFRATRVETAGRKTLDATRLLELGVLADTIMAATVIGKPSSSVRVTRMDDEKEQAANGNGHAWRRSA